MTRHKKFWWGAPWLLGIHVASKWLVAKSFDGGRFCSSLCMWRATQWLVTILVGGFSAPCYPRGGHANGSSQKVLVGGSLVPCYPSGGQRNDSSQFWWGDPRLLTIHVCGGQRNGSSQFWWGAPRLLTIHEPGNAMARHNSGGELLGWILAIHVASKWIVTKSFGGGQFCSSPSPWRARMTRRATCGGELRAPHCRRGGHACPVAQTNKWGRVGASGRLVARRFRSRNWRGVRFPSRSINAVHGKGKIMWWPGR